MRYRARDLLLVPSLLSLARIPLAVCFPLVIGWPVVGFAVLAAAGLSDILDGRYARRHGQVTATGAALDPITDKLFVLTVAITLVATRYLSISDVLLLSTREIGELPLVLWYALSPHARQARAEQPSANLSGKVSTTLQFATVTFALLYAPAGASGSLLAAGETACAAGLCTGPTLRILAAILLVVTALTGVFAALQYWLRALDLRAVTARMRRSDRECPIPSLQGTQRRLRS